MEEDGCDLEAMNGWMDEADEGFVVGFARLGIKNM